MKKPILLALPLALALAAAAQAATITEEEVAIQYNYGEMFANVANQEFKLVLRGNPFGADPAQFERGIVAQVQKNMPVPTTVTPRPAITDRRPDYRLVLLFNPAGGVPNWRLCDNLDNQPSTLPTAPGHVEVAAAYCRNEVALTSARARTDARGPDDPAINSLFSQLLPVLFPRVDPIRPQQRPNRPFR